MPQAYVGEVRLDCLQIRGIPIGLNWGSKIRYDDKKGNVVFHDGYFWQGT